MASNILRTIYCISILIIVAFKIKLLISLVSGEMSSTFKYGIDQPMTGGNTTANNVKQHYVLPSPDCSKKLLVYECSENTRNCSGLGDRERGMMSLFLLAIVTNRTFVIIHTSPCSLSDFFEPNVYNWSQCVSAVESTDDKLYIDGMEDIWEFPDLSKGGDIWEERVVVMVTNYMTNIRVRSHPRANETMPWIFDGPREYTTYIIFHALFKLTKSFEDHVDTVIRQLSLNGTRRLVGVHFRSQFLDPKLHLSFMKSIKELSKDSINTIYMATDDPSIRQYAAAHIPNCVTLNVSRVVLRLNIDGADCNSLYYAMVEQQILVRSNIMIKTPSELSTVAYMIRGKGSDVYEFRYKRINIRDTLEFPKTKRPVLI